MHTTLSRQSKSELLEALQSPNCTTLTFTVTSSGEIDDVQVVESNAPPRTVRQLRLSILASVYRPAFAYGEPVVTSVRLKQCYPGQ